jgi:hypothetical protein
MVRPFQCSTPDARIVTRRPWAEQRKRWIELFDGYWWGRGVPDHTSYEAKVVMDLQITFGALPNHHCALNSIAYTFQPPNYDDDEMVDPHTSPGVGAFSHHNGRTFHVKVCFRSVQSDLDQLEGNTKWHFICMMFTE